AAAITSSATGKASIHHKNVEFLPKAGDNLRQSRSTNKGKTITVPIGCREPARKKTPLRRPTAEQAQAAAGIPECNH
ncbi:MAG: hypothetical protein AAGB22_07725, partial [Bacteroidota bacterium]